MPFDLPKDIMRAPHEVHHVRDAQISAAIHTGIVSHPDLAASAKDIDVTTLDGLVTLRGVVHTRRDRDELDRLARSAPGVKHVDNRVRVVP